MKRGTKIFLVVACLILAGSLPTLAGCYHAYEERSKVSTGMQVADVFATLDEWDLCISSYLDEGTHEFGSFDAAHEPGGQSYRIAKYDKTFDSKEDFVQFVGQQMSNGKAWNSQFTYFAGAIRNTFRVDFDPKGKVINVSDMGGGP